MFQIEFMQEGRTAQAESGENLLAVMQREGITVDAPCGGQGKCGKCKVRLQTENGREEVLACQTKIETDLRVDTADVKLQSEGAQILMDAAVDTDRERTPQLQLIKVQVPPCPNGESTSDWTRFAEAVSRKLRDVENAAGMTSAETMGISEPIAFADATGNSAFMKANAAEGSAEADTGVQADQVRLPLQPAPAIASSLGQIVKEGKGEVYALLFADQVLQVSARPFPYYMAAFDIGTTTVAAYLLNGANGNVAARASCLNPQAQYGADVIGRANYVLENEMEPVSRCIREALNALMEEMAGEVGISTKDIYLLSVAGNTCMHHLFLGISPDSLVHAPYNPAISEEMILRAGDYGLRVNEQARLLMLPNIAGFVGADTVACLVASRLAEQEDWTLLIDIGTNGEMVLGKNHWMAACSTAAGPAFEGAGISCGMRGLPGAISKAAWAGDHWEMEVIGGGKKKGICGSGLLDLTAGLLVSGQMDESGELEEADGIQLASREESATGEPIYLLQKDIRQLQLAKAAIATGVRLLAKKLEVDLSQIKKVWLAGAFGSFLSPESACAIGLIPPELAGRITAIGNAAGEGAKQVLLDWKAWDYAKTVAGEADFLELATMKEFNDTYMDELLFPEQ